MHLYLTTTVDTVYWQEDYEKNARVATSKGVDLAKTLRSFMQKSDIQRDTPGPSGWSLAGHTVQWLELYIYKSTSLSQYIQRASANW